MVITKDSDFYYSHLLQQRPLKLLLVRTGNMRTHELKALLKTHLAEIVQAPDANSLVELHGATVRIVA